MESENNIGEVQENLLNKVTPLSKYLAMALFVILPFIGGWVGYTLAPEKIVDSVVVREVEVEKLVELPVPTNETVTNTKTYEDSELGFAFDYPADWGEITTHNESGTCPQGYVADNCNQRYLIAKGATFLSAETRGHSDYPIGRGAFWGDNASNISSNYLSKCESNNKVCTVVTNNNGLSFAFYKGTPDPEDIGGFSSPRYYIYNPNSQYYGVVLSLHQLNSQTQDNSELFKKTVIDSFRFIEPVSN